MKTMTGAHTYSARRIRRYNYPNEAAPEYFIGKLLDAVTAAVMGMGTVTLFLYLVTI